MDVDDIRVATAATQLTDYARRGEVEGHNVDVSSTQCGSDARLTRTAPPSLGNITRHHMHSESAALGLPQQSENPCIPAFDSDECPASERVRSQPVECFCCPLLILDAGLTQLAVELVQDLLQGEHSDWIHLHQLRRRWQLPHQKRLRPATTRVRMVEPQTRQARFWRL